LMTGCTRVEQCRWGKNFRRHSRTSCWSFPFASGLWRVFSRYWSGVSRRPASSVSSSVKSLSNHISAGALLSWPGSSTCLAMLHTSDRVLKSCSLSVPLVFRMKTDEIRRHSDISLASLLLSDSLAPKPSQSMNNNVEPSSAVSFADFAPHIQMPSVQAHVVEPTRNWALPAWIRPRRRFMR